MNDLIRHVKISANIVNLIYLIVKCWTKRKAIDLYDTVKHLGWKGIEDTLLLSEKYYNFLVKRKGILVREQQST